MLSGAQIFVVVPALDESKRIGAVLRGMPAFVDEIVVVDDGSRDGTADVARRFGADDPRVHVVSHAARRGVGAAIVTGYRRALAFDGGPRDAFVVMAGDGQMDPDDLPRLVEPLAEGAGYVKGNRFAWPGVASVMPTARYLGGQVFSTLTTVAVGAPVHDSQCGYTALARWACERMDLDAMWPGYGYPNDLLAMLARADVPFVEVPVRPVFAGEESKLRPWHVATIGWLVGRAISRRAAQHLGMARGKAPYYPAASRRS